MPITLKHFNFNVFQIYLCLWTKWKNKNGTMYISLEFSYCFADVNILMPLHIQLRYLEIGNSNRASFNYAHTIEMSN